MTKALWNDNSRKLLDAGHAKGKAIQAALATAGAGIPFHPGAEKFYKEEGLAEVRRGNTRDLIARRGGSLPAPFVCAAHRAAQGVPRNRVTQIDTTKTVELEQKFDPEMRFRPLVPPASLVVGVLLIVLSCFHYYTAGFGLLRETTHRGVHLAFVLGLVFLVFPARKSMLEKARRHAWLSPGGVPLVDWLLGLAIASSVLYIPWIFEDLAFRVGNPLPHRRRDGLDPRRRCCSRRRGARWAGRCR